MPEPSRSQQLEAAVDDSVNGSQRGRPKCVPAECKRAEDGIHVQQLCKDRWPDTYLCGWQISWRRDREGRHLVEFQCFHSLVCELCGNILNVAAPQDMCPHWPAEDQHTRIIAERDRRYAEAPSPDTRTRAAITGRKGYRKPKGTGKTR